MEQRQKRQTKRIELYILLPVASLARRQAISVSAIISSFLLTVIFKSKLELSAPSNQRNKK